MDAHTLELLEFDKVRELLAGYAACSLGKELARQLEPSTDVEKIRTEIALVTDMTEAIVAGQSPPFGGLHDVRLLVRRAAIGAMLSADQLLEVGETLACTGHMYRYRMRLDERFQRLINLLTPIEDLGTVAKTISGCIDSRGHVHDMASPALGKIRQQLAELDERVQNQIRRLLRDPELKKVLRYPNATVSGDHYVLPVAVNYRHKIQGVVHRTSSTGETLFIEPASVAALSSERAVIKGEEEREIKRILRKLSAEVGRVARPLTTAIETMAQLDLLHAKARFGRAFDMEAPDVNTEGRLWLRSARHPLLENLFRLRKTEGTSLVRGTEGPSAPLPPPGRTAGGEGPSAPLSLLAGIGVGGEGDTNSSSASPPSAAPPPSTTRGEGERNPSPPTTLLPGERGESRATTTENQPAQVVPIDVRLGSGFNLLIITGPNTGGKTVTLKTTGLLCLMAQSGLHIPALQGSQVPVFDSILADIGDEQSLEQSLSTFSSHITRIGQILRIATNQSLILLDELGAGTDPTEGAALGRAILDQLDHIGCRAMVTTHLGDLKTYAFHNDRAENGAVEFDVQTLRPTYRLHIGQFGMSNALRIARRLKLPRDLLQRAHKYLRRRQRRAPEMVQLQKMKEVAEKAREEALKAQLEAEQQREEYRQELERVQREKEKAAALREARLKLQAGDQVHVPRYDKVGKVVRVDHKKNIAVVSLGLGQWEVPLEEVFPVEST